MADKKVSWDDIPSLEGLKVDWNFEPKNTLGKRAQKRMKSTELHPILDVDRIYVKVAARNFEEKGYLLDLTSKGLAVCLNSRLDKDTPVKIGFFLGPQKIVSRALVKNSQEVDGMYKMGMVFEKLDGEYAEFITGIFASKISDL